MEELVTQCCLMVAMLWKILPYAIITGIFAWWVDKKTSGKGK